MSQSIGVKKLKAYRTNITSFEKNSSDKKFLHQLIELDEKSNPLREVLYAANGKPIEEVLMKYDDNGNTIERTTIHHEEGTAERVVYTYNTANKISEENLFYGDDFIEKTEFTYNDNGHLISSIKTDEGGILEKEIAERDAEGNPLHIQNFDGEDNLQWEHKLTYNAKGLATEEVHEDFNEGVKTRTLHTFDEQDRRIKSESYDAKNNLISLQEEEYDDAGNSIALHTSGTMPYANKTTKTTDYNTENKPVEMVWYDELNKIMLGKDNYEYDDKGNLIAQEIFEMKTSGGLQKVHYRLEYERELFEDVLI
ncbi:MAG: hypothetical protein NTX03_15155 [Bacteroidetes bacterium]|nr:hypothetical protein [Bacteroidota bacterium]